MIPLSNGLGSERNVLFVIYKGNDFLSNVSGIVFTMQYLSLVLKS